MTSQKVKTIGILGAGKLGIVIAQLALKAGYNVYIAGSGAKEKIFLTVQVLAPGSVAESSEQVVKNSDVVILALPLSKFRSIPKEALAGKLVIDAMNYWWEVDGPREDSVEPGVSSSDAVQAFLNDSRVVKAFNHIGYHDLYDESTIEGDSARKAMAIAGDSPNDAEIVADIVNDLGFDPLIIGGLKEGVKLEPGGKVFGAHVGIEELTRIVF